MIEWSCFKCGLFNNQLEIQHIEQLREDNLVKYLNWELVENNEYWSSFEHEKIESILEIEDEIFDYLIENLVNDYFL